MTIDTAFGRLHLGIAMLWPAVGQVPGALNAVDPDGISALQTRKHRAIRPHVASYFAVQG
jgi:hypothetical protein